MDLFCLVETRLCKPFSNLLELPGPLPIRHLLVRLTSGAHDLTDPVGDGNALCGVCEKGAEKELLAWQLVSGLT